MGEPVKFVCRKHGNGWRITHNGQMFAYMGTYAKALHIIRTIHNNNLGLATNGNHPH